MLAGSFRLQTICHTTNKLRPQRADRTKVPVTLVDWDLCVSVCVCVCVVCVRSLCTGECIVVLCPYTLCLM